MASGVVRGQVVGDPRSDPLAKDDDTNMTPQGRLGLQARAA